MKPRGVSRRTFLAHAAVVSTALSIPLGCPASAWAVEDSGEEPPSAVLTGQLSRNGWEMEKVVDDRGSIYLSPVPGTPLKGVHVRIGDVEKILVHVIRRFHYQVDQLCAGEAVIGWRSPETVNRSLPESNLASGTAVQIRPGHYPAGTRGNFFPLQLMVIRDILADLDGVVRWGGDDRDVNESLFYLDVPPGDVRLTTLVDKLYLWQDKPGGGAGASGDVTAPARRKAAAALERQQKKSAG